MLITNNRGEKMEFIQSDKDIEYKNPYGLIGGARKGDYKRYTPYVCVIDGGMLVCVHHEQFDFLINGEVVAQRAGASVDLLKLMIKHDMKACDYELSFKIQQMLDKKDLSCKN